MAEWWKEGVVYQIYPRSFQDSDGDGVGDLRGLTARLDKVVELGVDAIWISPIFPSPMDDFGYDIADYTGIDPIFGTMADFEALVAAADARGLKVLLDFVPAHSSDRHPWFQEARTGKDSPKRDWYVWADPGPDGGPPTNWISEFGGPAWTLDPGSGQYYLHIFLPSQPSLNWNNPEVAEAMLQAMAFWYDRGVAGFRVDAFENLNPAPPYKDNPPNPDWVQSMGPARSVLGTNTKHPPIAMQVARDMRALADRYDPPRVLIGEIYGSFEELMPYYGTNGDGFQLPFNFSLMETPWTAEAVAGTVETYESLLPPGAWPNWVLGNHDRPRLASRIGIAQTRVAAMLLCTLRGTPTIYQGEELGKENAVIPPEAVRDPWEKNVPGEGLGRDPVRTPMTWEDGDGAGFTTGTPWLPIAVPPEGSWAAQAGRNGSLLNLYRALLAFRRSEPALSLGDYVPVSSDGGVLAFRRTHGDRTVTVALNFTDAPATVDLTGPIRLSTHGRVDDFDGSLAPNEGVILG